VPLTNKKALITGGGSGLGLAIAHRLAQVGMDIALHCHSSADQAQQIAQNIGRQGQKCVVFHADLADHDQIEAMLEQISSQLGPVDVLVNNAAVFLPTPPDAFDTDVWQQTFRINVFAPAMLAKHIGMQMKARGAGRIINILTSLPNGPFPRTPPIAPPRPPWPA